MQDIKRNRAGDRIKLCVSGVHRQGNFGNAHRHLDRQIARLFDRHIARGLLEENKAYKCYASKELLDEAFDIYFSAYKEVTCAETYMYPGVLETLNYLDQEGYRMVICTNNPFGFIEPILDKLSIKKFFKCWIGEDSLAKKKPNAAPLFYLANEMNIVIENCIMVGDSKNDILAAQNSGMESIGVSYGYNYNENISDYNPTILVDSFSSLQKLF